MSRPARLEIVFTRAVACPVSPEPHLLITCLTTGGFSSNGSPEKCLSMILIVDAIFRGIHCPNMVRLVVDYEGAFETLNELFSQGFQLQGAIIKEGDSQLKVPVEAFDGQPIDLHLRALQTQWDQLLAVKPTPVTSTDYSLKAWLMGLDGYYDAFLAHLEKMIFLLQVQKGKIKSWRSVEVRNSLTQRVDTLLAINQRMHKQTLESRRINQERMHQLQK